MATSGNSDAVLLLTAHLSGSDGNGAKAFNDGGMGGVCKVGSRNGMQP